MPILPVLQSAILRVTGTKPPVVFSSTDQVCIEIADLCNEVAEDIAQSADWRNLTKVATISIASTEAHPLPIGYDRMVLASEVDDPATWFWGYEPFETVNEWMRYKSGGYNLISPGGWIIIGGEFNFYPAPSGQATFPYISKLWATSAAGVAKDAFTDDDDEFALDPALLRLGLIWRYRAQKGLDYAEVMKKYEIALAQQQSRDKGARVLRAGRSSFPGARLAYSGRIIR